MTGFNDLPKTVRETIYRIHLVQDGPVKFSEFKALCNCSNNDERTTTEGFNPARIMPTLLRVSRKSEREGMFKIIKAKSYETTS